MNERYDPRYLEGIACFNSRAYFQSHEVWELVWMETDDRSRTFYKGLIQAAVALHHLGNGNAHGAQKLEETAAGYLQDYRPQYLGLDLESFLGQLSTCVARGLARLGGGQRRIELESPPIIKLQPAGPVP